GQREVGGSRAHTAGVEVDEEFGKAALDHLERGEARAKTVEVVEEQVRDRAVRAPRILRVVAGSRGVERVGGPVESLVPGEAELGAAPAVELGASERDVAGVLDDHAGSCPDTTRGRPRIARAAAVDHAIAETTGESKSVPDAAAWKKSATNAR